MKEFVEGILLYERDLFLFLNGSDSVYCDNIMWIVSATKVWVPFYVFVAVSLFYKTIKKEAGLILFFFILMIVLCDQFSSGLVKPFFERLRPGHHPDFREVVDVVRGYRGGGFSFISGHATNSFGFAVFLSLLFRNQWVTLIALVWAAVISYSRIYLGMHFISDVIGGILAGTGIAVMMYTLLISLRKKIFHLEVDDTKKLFPEQHGRTVAVVFASYFLGVIIYGLAFP